MTSALGGRGLLAIFFFEMCGAVIAALLSCGFWSFSQLWHPALARDDCCLFSQIWALLPILSCVLERQACTIVCLGWHNNWHNVNCWMSFKRLLLKTTSLSASWTEEPGRNHLFVLSTT